MRGFSVATTLKTGGAESRHLSGAIPPFWSHSTFLEPFHLLPFDWDAAIKTAEIRYPLEKAGMKIGPYDLQLSGQALSLDLILVTHNTREFKRVNGLRVEDWESDGG